MHESSESIYKLKKPLFNTVALVGVGLIGGSLGLAIKKRRLARSVIGIARREETIKKALRKGAIDKGTLNLKEGVSEAQLVILCGPISTIVNQLKTIGKYVGTQTLVIDVGSTKLEIENTANQYFNCLTKRLAAQRQSGKALQFVGCHPMAGSEKTGVENAKADLFEGSICFVTTPNRIIENFWRRLGSQPVQLDVRLHDAIVAQISHLPHILSFSLFQHFKGLKVPITNRSILDFARLSKSDPEIWTDIFISNNEQILKAIKVFSSNLLKWQKALKGKDASAIRRLIYSANKLSFTLVQNQKEKTS